MKPRGVTSGNLNKAKLKVLEQTKGENRFCTKEYTVSTTFYVEIFKKYCPKYIFEKIV